jgi:hypothetical protein
MQGDDDAVTERVLGRRTYLRATGLTALGNADSAGDVSMPQTILIEAEGTVSYEFDVSGDVVPVPTAGNARDTIGNGTVSGTVADGLAVYHVTGDVSSVRIDGDGDIDYGHSARDRLQAPAHVLAIVAPPETAYELRTTGPIEGITGGPSVTAPQRDGEGWTASGSGPCVLAFEGTVQDLDVAGSGVSIELDGRPRPRCAVTEGESPQGREVVLTAPETVDYEFTATAGVEWADGKTPTDGTTLTHNDDGTWTVAGTVSDGLCESFTVYGTVTAFDPECGDFAVLVDGKVVTPGEVVDSDGDHTGTAIGGGASYPNDITAGGATTTVSTARELQAALDGATAGDTVFVAGDADIDVGTREVHVPEGVTLASDRGIDAAPGGLVETTEATWPMVTVHDDARVTGLRLGGPEETFVEYDSDGVGLGVAVVGSGVEIDNCELFGFASAAIRCGADTAVHHSYLHHIPMDRVGSAIRCTDGQPHIEYNYVNYTRNGVTATGKGGYTVAYNRFGSEVLDHALACDRPGGTTLTVHHNTVASADSEDAETAAIALRGTPTDCATVANNWFKTETSPGTTPANQGDAVVEPTDSRQNIEFLRNHYGTREPSRNLGHPR